MSAAAVFTALGGAFVAVLLIGVVRDERLRLVAKPAASACFIATALAGGALDSPYGRWVVVALVLSAAGDIALLGSSTPWFLGGLVSFLLGHIAYVVGFATRGVDIVWFSAAVAVLIVPLVVVMRWLLPHAGPLRIPTIAYGLVITAMVAAAAGTLGGDADLRIAIGAVAFYVSDLAVARNRFVASGTVNQMWGLPLYYGAQFLLAWTIGT